MQNHITVHSEVDIRQLLAAGDPAAFSRFYNQYRGKVYKAAYNVLRSREEAHEVIQELFITVWTIRSRFADVLSLEKYLHAMARNKSLTLLARRNKEMHFFMSEYQRAETTSPSPHSILEHDEFLTVYERSLRQLTARQRSVFKMAREEDMSHDEIAKCLAISPNTVNNHMKAALTTIRGVLSKHHSGN